MIGIERITTDENQEQRLMAYAKKAAEAQSKSIRETLEEIASDFCEHYCKYPDIFNADEEGCELSETEICAECPVNKLV